MRNRIKPLDEIDSGPLKIEGFTFICPGCNKTHVIYTKNHPQNLNWIFNDSLEKPTFTPSYICRGIGEDKDICHFFIKEGQIQFLNDCTHKLAGQTVDMHEL